MSVVKPIPGKNANPNQQTGCHQDVPNPQNETSNSFKSFREEFTLNEFLKQKQLYLFLYLYLYLYTYSFFLESIEPQLFVMFRSIQKTLAKAETIITKHKGRLLIGDLTWTKPALLSKGGPIWGPLKQQLIARPRESDWTSGNGVGKTGIYTTLPRCLCVCLMS